MRRKWFSLFLPLLLAVLQTGSEGLRKAEAYIVAANKEPWLAGGREQGLRRSFVFTSWLNAPGTGSSERIGL